MYSLKFCAYKWQNTSLLLSTSYSKDSQLHQKDQAEEKIISPLNFEQVMGAVY